MMPSPVATVPSRVSKTSRRRTWRTYAASSPAQHAVNSGLSSFVPRTTIQFCRDGAAYEDHGADKALGCDDGGAQLAAQASAHTTHRIKNVCTPCGTHDERFFVKFIDSRLRTLRSVCRSTRCEPRSGGESAPTLTPLSPPATTHRARLEDLHVRRFCLLDRLVKLDARLHLPRKVLVEARQALREDSQLLQADGARVTCCCVDTLSQTTHARKRRTRTHMPRAPFGSLPCPPRPSGWSG